MAYRHLQRPVYGQFLCTCKRCSQSTSRKFAREHAGLCKACTQDLGRPEQNHPATTFDQSVNQTPTREQRIIDHGYQAYAREEGHYDQGDF